MNFFLPMKSAFEKLNIKWRNPLLSVTDRKEGWIFEKKTWHGWTFADMHGFYGDLNIYNQISAESVPTQLSRSIHVHVFPTSRKYYNLIYRRFLPKFMEIWLNGFIEEIFYFLKLNNSSHFQFLCQKIKFLFYNSELFGRG